MPRSGVRAQLFRGLSPVTPVDGDLEPASDPSTNSEGSSSPHFHLSLDESSTSGSQADTLQEILREVAELRRSQARDKKEMDTLREQQIELQNRLDSQQQSRGAKRRQKVDPEISVSINFVSFN